MKRHINAKQDKKDAMDGYLTTKAQADCWVIQHLLANSSQSCRKAKLAQSQFKLQNLTKTIWLSYTVFYKK